MSDEIMQTSYGDLFVERGERVTGWHKKGVALPGATYEQLLEALHVDEVNFEKHPAVIKVGDQEVETKDYHLVRVASEAMGGLKDFGPVTPHFSFMQPSQFYQAFTGFAHKSEVAQGDDRFTVDTGAFLRNGGVAFVTFKGNRFDVQAGGKADEHQSWLVLMWSVINGLTPKLMYTSTRVVCWNTLYAAIKNATMKLSVPHSEGHSTIVEYIGQMMSKALGMRIAYKNALNMLAMKPIGDIQAEQYWASVFKAPESTKLMSTIDSLTEQRIPEMMNLIGGTTAPQIVMPEDVRDVYEASAMRNAYAQERAKEHRIAAKVAAQKMVDDGYGMSAYTALQSAMEVIEHGINGRGDRASDLLLGNRTRVEQIAVNEAFALLK